MSTTSNVLWTTEGKKVTHERSIPYHVVQVCALLAGEEWKEMVLDRKDFDSESDAIVLRARLPPFSNGSPPLTMKSTAMTIKREMSFDDAAEMVLAHMEDSMRNGSPMLPGWKEAAKFIHLNSGFLFQTRFAFAKMMGNISVDGESEVPVPEALLRVLWAQYGHTFDNLSVASKKHSDGIRVSVRAWGSPGVVRGTERMEGMEPRHIYDLALRFHLDRPGASSAALAEAEKHYTPGAFERDILGRAITLTIWSYSAPIPMDTMRCLWHAFKKSSARMIQMRTAANHDGGETTHFIEASCHLPLGSGIQYRIRIEPNDDCIASISRAIGTMEIHEDSRLMSISAKILSDALDEAQRLSWAKVRCPYLADKDMMSGEVKP